MIRNVMKLIRRVIVVLIRVITVKELIDRLLALNPNFSHSLSLVASA